MPKIQMLSLSVPTQGSGEQRFQSVGMGVCLVPPENGLPALAVIFNDPNIGLLQSGTDATAGVLELMRTFVPVITRLEDTNWVQIGQDGGFDHLQPEWGYNECRRYTWSPLRWPGKPPRSRSAFVGMFAPSACRALEQIEKLPRGR